MLYVWSSELSIGGNPAGGQLMKGSVMMIDDHGYGMKRSLNMRSHGPKFFNMGDRS